MGRPAKTKQAPTPPKAKGLPTVEVTKEGKPIPQKKGGGAARVEKAKRENVIDFVIAGNYYKKDNNGLASFELPFTCTQELAEKHSVPGAFLKGPGKRLAKEKYPDFQDFEKFYIKSQVASNPDKVAGMVDLMSHNQLLGYIEENGYEYDDEDGSGIYLALFPDHAKLRQAIKDIESNSDAFYAYQSKQIELHGAELADKAELNSLNGLDAGTLAHKDDFEV